MKRAEKINDITNAFKNGPLEKAELSDFYCDGTMEFRTGDKYSSPIQDISQACQMPSESNAFLLLGHKGCGKSTELNKMSAELTGKGYSVSTVQCGRDLDLLNLVYSDLLTLMGEALLKIASDIQCNLSREIVKRLKLFWCKELEETKTTADAASLSIEAGIQTESTKFLSVMLQVFAKVKGDLKYNEERRTVCRTKMSNRSSDWLLLMNQIADEITKQLEGKQPIIIFEDLDKINPEDARDVFCNYAATLTGISFPVIYTFPIALSYSSLFAALEGYFTPKTLPVIKQETMEGSPYQEGENIVIEIVKKRADLALFDENVLKNMIYKTGGSLRDLFYAINAASQRAIRREVDTVSIEDMKKALEELQTSLIRRIERKHYSFLVDIYKGNRRNIEDKEMLLEMLQANVVLEYNGRRWHNVHPLIVDFLREQGLIEA